MRGLGPVPLRLRGGLDEIMARQRREAALLAAEQTLRYIGPPQPPNATAADKSATMPGAATDWGGDNMSEWRDFPQLMRDDCYDDVDGRRSTESPMPLPRGVKWCGHLLCRHGPRLDEQRVCVLRKIVFSLFVCGDRLLATRPSA